MTVAEAYTACREVARREAKNFYWSFRVLPPAKSDAMCAVYAFMRRADDLSDDESVSVEERRERMEAWRSAWRRRAPESELDAVDRPIFLALADAQERFQIPEKLFEELVEGVSMDLEPQAVGEHGFQTFADFDALYRYCYLVASVVGLVCIRIFGYTDERAEVYAEETGIAFQLTNILRDVREDVERNRLYVPMDLLAEFEVPTERMRALAEGEAMTPQERALLATMGVRAEQFYRSADRLIPLISRDSRAAMWVLKTVYHRLLDRIAARRMEVFSERVSVPDWEKVAILARGAAMAMWNRVPGR